VDGLIEYGTNGQLIRKIVLCNVTAPVHAIQWNSRQYLVSHGGSEHGLCVVGQRGQVLKRYDCEPGSAAGHHLSDPRYLAVDKDGFVYVADRANNRVVVLDRTLNWSRDLKASVDGEMQQPLALYLDESRERLFVSEWGAGDRLLVINVLSNN
jgi:DNA-binding beta-propeller fold protein YncE